MGRTNRREDRGVVRADTSSAIPCRYGQSVVGVIQNFAESSIVVWNWQAGADPVSHTFSYYNQIAQVFVDEHTQTIRVAADKGLRSYGLGDGSKLSEPSELLKQADWVRDLATSPDGRWITTAGADGGVLVWYGEFTRLPARPTYELCAHRGGVNQVGFLDGGKVVISLGIDGMVRRWDYPKRLASMRTKTRSTAWT
jgi:WD40 repeat protein